MVHGLNYTKYGRYLYLPYLIIPKVMKVRFSRVRVSNNVRFRTIPGTILCTLAPVISYH